MSYGIRNELDVPLGFLDPGVLSGRSVGPNGLEVSLDGTVGSADLDIPVGNWVQLGIAVDHEGVEVMLDGVGVYTSGESPSPAGDLVLGATADGAVAALDELMVFSERLTAESLERATQPPSAAIEDPIPTQDKLCFNTIPPGPLLPGSTDEIQERHQHVAALVHDLGASVARLGMAWGDLENDGSFGFGEYLRVLDTLACDHGIGFSIVETIIHTSELGVGPEDFDPATLESEGTWPGFDDPTFDASCDLTPHLVAFDGGNEVNVWLNENTDEIGTYKDFPPPLHHESGQNTGPLITPWWG